MARNTGRSKSSGPLSGLSLEILAFLKREFVERGRSSEDLTISYVGPNMAQLQSHFLQSCAVSRVDYDLALKELEERGLVGTGPIAAYENDPNSGFFVLTTISKREYIYLKEEGYKIARNEPPKAASSARQSVHISGGNFYQSPIGVGGQVTQNISFDITDESDSVKYLAELLAQAGQPVNDATRAHLLEMVKAANAGDMAAAKPIFHKVFEMVAEPVKQVAYGVLAAIVTNQMGM